MCGKCVCSDESGYFGRTCEDCATCALPCENNRDCVQCKVFGTGKKTSAMLMAPITGSAGLSSSSPGGGMYLSSAQSVRCDEECDGLELNEVATLGATDANHKLCQFNDAADNCTFFFSYDIYNDKRIRYVRAKDCASTFPTWAIIAIIAGSVLLVGCTLLVAWKIVDTLQQKRECARFNEEKKRAAWESVRFLFREN